MLQQNSNFCSFVLPLFNVVLPLYSYILCCVVSLLHPLGSWFAPLFPLPIDAVSLFFAVFHTSSASLLHHSWTHLLLLSPHFAFPVTLLIELLPTAYGRDGMQEWHVCTSTDGMHRQYRGSDSRLASSIWPQDFPVLSHGAEMLAAQWAGNAFPVWARTGILPYCCIIIGGQRPHSCEL